MTGEKTIRVGSRKSELALIQTKHVISRLQKNFPNKNFEIHTMSTMGDRVLNISLPKIGEKSLFTRDLEEALRNGGVDFVVHSLKDLPTALPAGMAIGAVLQREDARDALVLRKEFQGHTIATLPKGSVIGTSSLRRTAQIRRQYTNLQVCDIRGNLNTRLAKLDAADSKFAGIVLAQAGLMRMGWEERISQVLEPVDLLYAVGQGALAVECRANDNEVLNMLRSLMCMPTTCRILAERSFLKTLGGGCSAPVAVCSTLKELDDDDKQLSLIGAVWSLDGNTQIRDELTDELQSAKQHVDIEPPTKRARREHNEYDTKNGNNNNNNNTNIPKRESPPIIDEDGNLAQLAKSYGMQELLEKHMDLAKQCPVVGGADNDTKLNAENGKMTLLGAGDACSQAAEVQHCPLPIGVGQDFMGECPFVSKEAKVAASHCGMCPITGAKDVPDNVSRISPQKCPFSKRNEQVKEKITSPKCPFTKQNATTIVEHQGQGDASTSAHAKCPFLQKVAVPMFDYADEEKPEPSARSSNSVADLTEAVCDTLDDTLFCGLYAHACYKRELFTRSQRLGQQLAEQLITQGALEVMKYAQAEIHSKIE